MGVLHISQMHLDGATNAVLPQESSCGTLRNSPCTNGLDRVAFPVRALALFVSVHFLTGPHCVSA